MKLHGKNLARNAFALGHVTGLGYAPRQTSTRYVPRARRFSRPSQQIFLIASNQRVPPGTMPCATRVCRPGAGHPSLQRQNNPFADVGRSEGCARNLGGFGQALLECQGDADGLRAIQGALELDHAGVTCPWLTFFVTLAEGRLHIGTRLLRRRWIDDLRNGAAGRRPRRTRCRTESARTPPCLRVGFAVKAFDLFAGLGGALTPRDEPAVRGLPFVASRRAAPRRRRAARVVRAPQRERNHREQSPCPPCSRWLHPSRSHVLAAHSNRRRFTEHGVDV